MACPSCAFCTKDIYFNLVQQHVTQQAICVLQLKPSPLSSHRNYVSVGFQYHFSQKQGDPAERLYEPKGCSQIKTGECCCR